MDKYTHWTEEPENIRFRERVDNLKPSGIWISVNGSWERWLEGNWEEWYGNKKCVEIELTQDINLFIIDSLETFLNKFKELTGGDYDTILTNPESVKIFHQKLKECYDGIWLKSEPFYAYRLDCMYFYPWDCESICVWNINKISVKEGKNGRRNRCFKKET